MTSNKLRPKSSDEGGWLRLDLAAAECRRLTLHGHVPLNAAELDELTAIVEATDAKKAPPWTFVDSYFARSHRYGVSSRLARYPSDKDYTLDLAIFATKTAPPHKVPRTRDLLNVLTRSRSQAELTATLDFYYARKRASSVLRLPLKLANAPMSGSYEMRGVRLSQVDDSGEVHHSILVDSPFDTWTRVEVSLLADAVVSSSYIETSLNSAVRLVQTLFPPVGAHKVVEPQRSGDPQ